MFRAGCERFIAQNNKYQPYSVETKQDTHNTFRKGETMANKNTHYNYEIQAWIEYGVVSRCGHPEQTRCTACYMSGLDEAEAIAEYRKFGYKGNQNA